MKSVPAEIRPMALGDLDEIVRIEESLFSDPWSRALFAQEVANQRTACTFVASIDDCVAAYIIGWVILDELHIGNVAVSAAWQRRGLATELVRRLRDEAVSRGCRRATLEVRVTNEPAILLYRCHGFRPVALRSGYYRDNGEDALIMWADLIRERSAPEQHVAEDNPLGKSRPPQ